MNQAKILFLDIETSPTLAWSFRRFKANIGLDQVEADGFVLCAAWKWLGNREVFSSQMEPNSVSEDDSLVIAPVWKALNDADIVVAHNGKDFDLPILNASFIKHGLPPPSPYKIVDTLETAKKNFRFPSNKLEGLLRFLGLGNKHKTDFDLWKGCLHGDETCWKNMVSYCRNDVTKLESVYKRLLPWMAGHPNVNLYTGATDRPRCPRCGSSHIQFRGKTVRTPTQIYRAFQCQNRNCMAWSRERSSMISREDRKNVLDSVPVKS